MNPDELPEDLRLDMLSSLKVLGSRRLEPEGWNSIGRLLAALSEALEKGSPSRVQQVVDDIDRLGPTRAMRIPSQMLGDPGAGRPPDQVMEYLNRIIHVYQTQPPAAPAAGA